MNKIIRDIENEKTQHNITNFETVKKFDELKLINNNNSKVSSFLTIQEGCDKFCKFCVVPYTRGPEYSRNFEDVLNEADELISKGTREIILQDYITFARAKGLSEKRVVMVHVMKNILIPIVTVIGLEFGSLIAFSTVTETVFAWPGMGKLIIDSIYNLDRPVIVAYLMIIVTFFVFLNLAVDILYTFLDPRVRIKGTEQ